MKTDGDLMEGQRLGLVFGLVFLVGCASIVYLVNYSLWSNSFDFSPLFPSLKFVGYNVFPDENGNDVFIVLQIKNTGTVSIVIDNELQTITNSELHNHLLDNPPKYVFQDRTLHVKETTTLYVSIHEYDSWHQTLEPISHWYDHPSLIKFRITAQSEPQVTSCHTMVTMPY